ncbi:MAG: hypothetical protein JW809_09730 [Pirellulales bacterium]|nr:hypothetical protein [Pirellulales bacterium]
MASRAALCLVILLIVIGAAIMGACLWPRSCPLSVCPECYTGYYRGLDIGGPGLLGRSFYRLVLPPSDEADGWTEIDYRGEGWNAFRGTYPDGTLREEGECRVGSNGPDDPAPDIHDVKWGKYHDPKGVIVSEIVDGTGRQTYFAADGTKIWELDLKDGQRTRHAMWAPNGQITSEQRYIDGKVHGPFVGYYHSGVKRVEGTKSRGKDVGLWTWYKPDGTVERVEDHGGTDTNDAMADRKEEKP